MRSRTRSITSPSCVGLGGCCLPLWPSALDRSPCALSPVAPSPAAPSLDPSACWLPVGWPLVEELPFELRASREEFCVEFSPALSPELLSLLPLSLLPLSPAPREPERLADELLEEAEPP